MRDHSKLVRDLLDRGLTIANGGKHQKVTDGDKVVVISSTPGRGRGDKNVLSVLRQNGMADPPSGGAPKRGRRPERYVKPYDGPRLPPGRIPRKETQ